MQNETPFSLLVWEDASNLPFPPEVSELIKSVKWQTFEWHTFGLPIAFAKFNVSGGKELYLSELPSGEIKVQKMSEFTGDIAIGGFFMDEGNPEGFNYYIQFLVTFCKGQAIDIRLNGTQKQSMKEYQQAIDEFQTSLNRVTKITTSCWFKWLYRPYFLIVRGIGFVLFLFIRDVVTWIIQKMTPL